MRYSFKSHVIHVSGSRMIYQGTDGASRGETQHTKALSNPIRKFAPINLAAFERSPHLKEWVMHWVGTNPFMLKPKHCFLST